MARRRFFWQLYTSYLLVALASLVGVGWFASYALQQFYRQTVRDNLHVRARLVEQRIGDTLDDARASKLQLFLNQFANTTSTRITVIDENGRVLCDTDEDPAEMENHRTRPEIAAAVAGGVGQRTRYSTTVRKRMEYLAIPVTRGGRLVAVVRTSLPEMEIKEATWAIRRRIIAGGVMMAASAALLSLFVSRRVSRPLEEMRQGAQRFASGDLAHDMPLPASVEMAALAEALNQMARQLQQRIATIERQRNEQQAVLASMVEGVLAVDARGRIISVNAAAAELLDVDRDVSAGLSLEQVVRNVQLRRFVARAMTSERPIEDEIEVQRDSPRILRAHGAALRDEDTSGVGAVVVLDDVTSYRRLETMRRDFVANVSHELKTPIASIKGFVETLRDGALENPEDARRFLEIVEKQADRLNAIIEDLLSLAKIEQAEDTADIELEENGIAGVLEVARGLSINAARAKNVEISIACPADLTARISPPLLEQAVTNLLDNAVKYSHDHGRVEIVAARADGEVTIAVGDGGCGIPPEHLPRLFERFYRVDQARSRKLGGTGLGLAIVKHIVQIHGGRVTVNSTPEVGSVFTIHLPGANR